MGVFFSPAFTHQLGTDSLAIDAIDLPGYWGGCGWNWNDASINWNPNPLTGWHDNMVKWGFSMWLKFDDVANHAVLYDALIPAYEQTIFYYTAGPAPYIRWSYYEYYGAALYRYCDFTLPSPPASGEWFHLYLQWDGDEAIEADRVRVWANNQEIVGVFSGTKPAFPAAMTNGNRYTGYLGAGYNTAFIDYSLKGRSAQVRSWFQSTGGSFPDPAIWVPNLYGGGLGYQDQLPEDGTFPDKTIEYLFINGDLEDTYTINQTNGQNASQATYFTRGGGTPEYLP